MARHGGPSSQQQPPPRPQPRPGHRETTWPITATRRWEGPRRPSPGFDPARFRHPSPYPPPQPSPARADWPTEARDACWASESARLRHPGRPVRVRRTPVTALGPSLTMPPVPCVGGRQPRQAPDSDATSTDASPSRLRADESPSQANAVRVACAQSESPVSPARAESGCSPDRSESGGPGPARAAGTQSAGPSELPALLAAFDQFKTNFDHC